jgi:hypothetical protein
MEITEIRRFHNHSTSCAQPVYHRIRSRSSPIRSCSLSMISRISGRSGASPSQFSARFAQDVLVLANGETLNGAEVGGLEIFAQLLAVLGAAGLVFGSLFRLIPGDGLRRRSQR